MAANGDGEFSFGNGLTKIKTQKRVNNDICHDDSVLAMKAQNIDELHSLQTFGTPDFTIHNAGQFPCNRYTHYMAPSISVDINLARREMVILGAQYAGEMKKGLFGVMHYLMPKRGILSFHSGCNMGKDGDVALFFGLPGTLSLC